MRKSSLLLLIAALLSLGFAFADFTVRTSKAQDTPPAVATPTEVVAQIMDMIGQGRIDDGMLLMAGFKDQLDLREAARQRLIHVRSEEGAYRGYEVAATQRFTTQFESVNVLAYYDAQPVLYRFHFYRPQKQSDVKWLVLGFQVNTDLPEIAELLKDTPIDYPSRKP